MQEPETVAVAETTETIDTLRLRVRQLEAENAAMRPIVLRMAEARACRDTVTMIESCPHCSLKRGGEYGYAGKHDETCMVSRARALGF
jgi:predicted nucleic acid binding AN1-type Zn finger protein